MKPSFPHGQYRQKGIVLFVTLIFLLILGVVAFSTSSTTVLSEKIAGNQWEQDRAYQAAESALIDGAEWLYGLPNIEEPEGDSTASDGIWEVGTMANKLYDPTYNWSDAKSFGTDTGASTAAFSDNYAVPRYLVENIGWSSDDASPENASAGFITFYYGVNAVGYGRGEYARSVLQTISSKRFH